MLAISVLPAIDARAQEREGFNLIQPERVEFKPYWYIQPQIGGGITIGETHDITKLISPAAALNVGYRMRPCFGLRAGLSGWQGKGYMAAPEFDYKFDYAQANVDAILSLTNLVCGFNPNRVLDLYLGVGIGGAYGTDNKEAQNFKAVNGEFEKLWSDKRWFLAGRGIIDLDINLSSIFAINVEANVNMMPDSWNSKNGHNKDWQFNGMIGCTVKFGSNKRIIPAVYEEIVMDIPGPEPIVFSEPVITTEPVAEVENIEPIKEYIFFLINSDEIRPEEMAKVDRLVKFMKANSDFRVSVTGYADRETGTGPYNMKLSVKRAHAVADALIHAGIHANRITVSAEGDKVQPFTSSEYTKNRVAICITEK